MLRKLTKQDLFERVLAAVAECGWSAASLDSPLKHPFRLALISQDAAINVRVYIWNVSHGGGHRAEEEFRIQVTGVPAGIVAEPGFKTLILGYWARDGIFVGFDFRHHHGQIGYSPSLQIREEALERANLHGFATHRKGSDELAVAFRPDFLIEYCRSLEEMHALGDSAPSSEVLDAIAEDTTQVNTAAIDSAPPERRHVLRRVAAGHIAAQFRRRVLVAYQLRCAFCGVQLGLVEAAHIVPASSPDTSFQTSNGIALCALHHRAFDGGLVAFNTRYRVMVNEDMFEMLRGQHLSGGEEAFRANLRDLLHLPPSVTDRPLESFVRRGLQARRWPSGSW